MNAVVPLRQVIAADEGRGNFAFMPAYSSKLGAAGIKIVNIFRVIGSVVKQQLLGEFYSWMTRGGEVLALMDGSYLSSAQEQRKSAQL